MDSSLWWSVVAGACTALGAILLFFRRRWSNRSLAFFLGLASGVMVAVVAFDMLPSGLVYGSIMKTLIGLGIGILIMAMFNSVLFEAIDSAQTLVSLGYMIMLGIALHDLPEGMAIAFGGEMKARTGMVIATGIGIHNIPEGMAIAAPLLMSGMKKRRVLLQTLALGLITPIGTVLGQYMVRILPDLLPLMLGLASGVMVYLVMIQLWPQAGNKDRKARWWGLFLGMVLILMATYI